MATNLTNAEKRALNHLAAGAPNLGNNIKTFLTGEAGRISAEGLRVTAESLRVTAENGRSDAEDLRVIAEEARAANGPFSIAYDYDFAVDGGLVGDIAPAGWTLNIPLDAIVTNIKSDIITPFTSGGSATIKLARGTQELMAALAFDNGGLNGIDDHSVANVKITTGGPLKMVVAVAALTAGKGRFTVFYNAGAPTV